MPAPSAAPDLDVPWTRTPPAARVRDLVVCGVLGAAMDAYTRRTVDGRAALAALTGPVVLVANHSSHMDTPMLLRALPGAVRRRTAVVAAADYFFARRRDAIAASLAFATVPLDREGGGLGAEQVGHIDAHLRDGGVLVVYAEGSRSHDGRMGRLRSGGAVLAARHGAPVVPVHLAGTATAMPRGRRWMVVRGGRPGRGRHPVGVRFGAPIHPAEGLGVEDVMARVAGFLGEHGAGGGGEAVDPAPQRAVGAAAPPRG